MNVKGPHCCYRGLDGGENNTDVPGGSEDRKWAAIMNKNSEGSQGVDEAVVSVFADVNLY